MLLSDHVLSMNAMQAPRLCNVPFAAAVVVELSCLTLLVPPGSSVHGISQARILVWVAFCFSRGSYRPTDRTRVSCISCTGR